MSHHLGNVVERERESTTQKKKIAGKLETDAASAVYSIRERWSNFSSQLVKHTHTVAPERLGLWPPVNEVMSACDPILQVKTLWEIFCAKQSRELFFALNGFFHLKDFWGQESKPSVSWFDFTTTNNQYDSCDPTYTPTSKAHSLLNFSFVSSFIKVKSYMLWWLFLSKHYLTLKLVARQPHSKKTLKKNHTA